MTVIATGELAQAWGKLQAIVPLTAIHNEQQYEQALETLDVLLDVVGEDETPPIIRLLRLNRRSGTSTPNNKKGD